MAKAKLDEAKAQDVADRAANRAAKTKAKEKDLYGQLVAENQALVRDYYNAAAAVLKYGDASEITEQKLNEMRAAALAGQQQLLSIESGAGRFQRNVGNYSGALTGLTFSAQQLAGEIPNFFQSLQIGLRAITNNIQPVIQNMQQLKRENVELAAAGKPTVNSFKALAGAFLGWQTLLFVGVGLLAKYGPELYEMAAGTKAATEAKKALKEQQEALNSADKQAVKSAGQQIAELRTLEDTITNSNLTMKQRVAAYNEANKLYPDYLSKVSQDKALNGGLADIINTKLIPAILAAARARAYQEKINTLTAANIDLEQKQTQIIKDKAAAQVSANNASAKAAQIARNQQGSGRDFGQGAARTSLQQELNTVEDLTKAQNENSKARIENNNQIQQMAASLQNLQAVTSGIGGAVNLPIEKALKRIEYDLTKLPNAPFEKLKSGFTETAQISTLSAEQISKAANDIAESVKRAEIDKQLEEQLKNIQQLLGETLQNTVAVFAQGVGNLIAGTGGLGDIFSGLGQMLGDQIIAFGKQLIIAGGLMETAKKAVQALGITGIPAVIAGGAAIAIGSALKSALSKRQSRIGKFADGGVVYGPTNALVGEYSGASGNPEVIAPLDKLTSILRQQNIGSRQMVPVVLDTRIQGQDLLLIHNRAQRSANR